LPPSSASTRSVGKSSTIPAQSAASEVTRLCFAASCCRRPRPGSGGRLGLAKRLARRHGCVAVTERFHFWPQWVGSMPRSPTTMTLPRMRK
jgi:hypothetical protein